MKISLVMATVGRIDELHRLIDSLERQTSQEFELIIADQNSDGLLETVLKRLSSSDICFKHIMTPTKGLSKARNNALPYTRNGIIGYPDDDCWYEEEVIEKVADFFLNNPDVDGVVGRWCERDIAYDKGFFLNNERWRQFRIGIAGSSICLFMRRELVDKVSGFDERLGVPQWFGAGEETDFIMRCLASDAKLQYVPNIRVHHPIKSINDKYTNHVLEQVRKRSRGTGALYRKHRLSWSVITRGLLSPFMKLFFPPYSFRRIQTNFLITIGRVEGMLSWRESTDRKNTKATSKKLFEFSLL